MAQQRTQSTAAAKATEVQAAAEMVLAKERKRKRRAKARERRQLHERALAQAAAVEQMQNSIETMKKCIVAITTIMFLGIVIAVWTLWALHSQVVKVQAEVEKVQPQVEKIIGEVTDIVDEVEKVREALRNPMQSIGSAFGRQLDEKLEAYLGNRLAPNQ